MCPLSRILTSTIKNKILMAYLMAIDMVFVQLVCGIAYSGSAIRGARIYATKYNFPELAQPRRHCFLTFKGTDSLNCSVSLQETGSRFPVQPSAASAYDFCRMFLVLPLAVHISG